MATRSEDWDARRAKREQMRAKQKARQKKLMIILAAAVALLLWVLKNFYYIQNLIE